MNDLKIVIERVDKICDFVNKMKKDYKNLKERVQEKENKINELETIVKSFDRITRNVEYMEEIKQVVNKKISNLDDNISAKINAAESKIDVLTSNSSFEERSQNLQAEISSVNDRLAKLNNEYVALSIAVNQRLKACQEKNTKEKEGEHSLDQVMPQMANTSATIVESSSPRDAFKCRICGNLCGSLQDLRYHLKTVHKTLSECKQCEKKFLTSSQLESHLKEHGNVKKHKCQECDKTFYFKWRLQSHNKIHDKESSIRKCHFFNNNKQCPFEEIGCKYLHEKSLHCKFEDKCKFDKCQFRH